MILFMKLLLLFIIIIISYYLYSDIAPISYLNHH